MSEKEKMGVFVPATLTPDTQMLFRRFCICSVLWLGNIRDLHTLLCLIYMVSLLTGHYFFMLMYLHLRNEHSPTQRSPAACNTWHYSGYK